MTKRRSSWDANGVKALRRHLQMTQEELAREMGTRQQTISEWETGMYRPRGISERLLGMVAERAGFAYGDVPDEPAGTDARAGSS
jgi:DNA-binding transcriptional regulator YiaG